MKEIGDHQHLNKQDMETKTSQTALTPPEPMRYPIVQSKLATEIQADQRDIDST